ncbi:MAG: ribose-5-phosphate isomerase RpiA [Pseudomonadota bacterium]
MPNPLPPADRAKFCASRAALMEVEDGMRVGLGTGSTANWFVRLLAERVRTEGLKVSAAATSDRTAELATKLGLTITPLDDIGWLDLTVDGADEVNPALNLIKGGGGAHLREKIVATASDRMVVIADDGKMVDRLGAFPLPVEVVPFGWKTTRDLIGEILEELDMGAANATLRMSESAPFLTDQNNYVLDLHVHAIPDEVALDEELNSVPGIVEHGLFIDIAEQVFVGHPSGEVRKVEASGDTSPVVFTDRLDEDAFLSGLQD